ncbi:MAG TPA: ACT domain-containing protein [Geminicoccaceae bacterium]|nr:ACT domain-containing protein [Geminicoccus sp.]HMU50727.1 ACT domain-containing protein [Geminicoccaceae bacterium]
MTRRIDILPGLFSICRLPAGAAWPTQPGRDFTSVTATADELSLILPEEDAPEGAARSDGWRCLKLEGPFDLAETGILAPLAAALAAAGVALVPVGTFDTDYLLVRDDRLATAVEALERAGCTVMPVGPSSPG